MLFRLQSLCKVELHLKAIVSVRVCSLVARERINQFEPNLVCLFLETKKVFYEG